MSRTLRADRHAQAGLARKTAVVLGLAVAAAVLGVLVATPNGNSSTPGLVAAYAFDEGSGTTVTDASGNSNSGTAASTTWSSSGKYGKALSFNGTSSRVTIPDTASLHLSSAMTLEAWVRPSAVTNKWRDVIEKGNDNYYLEATSNKSSRPAGGAIIGGSTAEASGTTALAVNTWTHLAATYDGSALRLYVNGNLTRTTAKTGAITASTGALTIGSDPFYGQYFAGLIDEIRIYNIALTQAQIQSDMAAALGGAGHAGAVGARDALGDGGLGHPRRPRVGGGDRQSRRDRIPDRALPGSRVHELRPDRRAGGNRDQLQRHHRRQRDEL